jgi:SEC-C motif-containing protein
MNRTPPSAVIQELRREVGFGCPVRGCGNPYLKWHHFDPPWNVEHHHRSAGMIALCAEHHDKADANAFTKEQLRDLKAQARAGADVEGRFDWLRRELAIRVGSNFYFHTPIVLTFRKAPLIWFTNDERGHQLLNIRLLSRSGEPRWVMQDSYWMLAGSPADVVCPPSGRLVDVRYSNGDRVRVEFREIGSAEDGWKVFPEFWPADNVGEYPATACDVTYRIAGTTIDVTPNYLRAGGSSIRHSTFSRCGPISLGEFPGAMFNIGEAAMFPESFKLGRNDPCACGSGRKFKKCCGRPGA